MEDDWLKRLSRDDGAVALAKLRGPFDVKPLAYGILAMIVSAIGMDAAFTVAVAAAISYIETVREMLSKELPRIHALQELLAKGSTQVRDVDVFGAKQGGYYGSLAGLVFSTGWERLLGGIIGRLSSGNERALSIYRILIAPFARLGDVLMALVLAVTMPFWIIGGVASILTQKVFGSKVLAEAFLIALELSGIEFNGKGYRIASYVISSICLLASLNMMAARYTLLCYAIGANIHSISDQRDLLEAVVYAARVYCAIPMTSGEMAEALVRNEDGQCFKRDGSIRARLELTETVPGKQTHLEAGTEAVNVNDDWNRSELRQGALEGLKRLYRTRLSGKDRGIESEEEGLSRSEEVDSVSFWFSP